MRTLIVVLALSMSLCAQSQPGAEKQQLLWNKMTSEIQQVDHELDGVLGVAVLDLSSGQSFLLNGDEVFPQASAIKITVLAELYRQEAAGKKRLAEGYVVRREDLVPDSDILGGLTPGVTQLTLRDVATMMIAVSDNSATNVLIDRLGMENVNGTLDSLGLRQTRLRRKMMDLKAASEGRENISTPRQMMTLLEQAYRGKLFNKELTEDFLKMLATPKNSWVGRALPEETRYATKTGSLEAVRTESGIIFAANRPFVLCVMTTYLRDESAGQAAITRIAQIAFRYFDRAGRASPYGRVISPR